MIEKLFADPRSTRSPRENAHVMTESQHPLPPHQGAATVISLVLVLVTGIVISGCASSTTETSVEEPKPAEETVSNLAERWGVEVVALRLTGANYMLDFRYRVLDPEKAAELFERANKPVLIHHETGSELEVPRPAKTGPLRPTNPPEAGRVYFMLFSNPGMVEAGDEVTVRIGDFEAEVVVE
jgi:hypothetical protein